MADNKKYYYIRLKDNFFDSNEIVLLESMQDGYLYSNILLKLYLRSLSNNGKLMFNDRIPYNPQMLAAITRHSIGTVEKALQIFREMGLIEILDNGAIYILDIQNFIGESSTEADRKRFYRALINAEREGIGQMSLECPDKSPPEIDIEIDIEIDKKKERKTMTTKFAPPTVDDVKSYCAERGNVVDAERFVDYYSAKGWMIGKNKMRDWKAAVRTWERRGNNGQRVATTTEQVSAGDSREGQKIGMYL